MVLFGRRTCRSLFCRSRGSGPRSWRACGWWRWWSWTGSSARGTSWKSCWCFCRCRPPDPGRLMRDRPWVNTSNWTENLNNLTVFVNFSNLDVTHGLDVWIPTYICLLAIIKQNERQKHFQTLSVVREMISMSSLEPWWCRTYFPRDFWSVRSPCVACRSRRNIPARKKGRVNWRVRSTTRESALDWRSVLTLWTMPLRSVFMTSFTLACWVFTVGSWKTNRLWIKCKKKKSEIVFLWTAKNKTNNNYKTRSGECKQSVINTQALPGKGNQTGRTVRKQTNKKPQTVGFSTTSWPERILHTVFILISALWRPAVGNVGQHNCLFTSKYKDFRLPRIYLLYLGTLKNYF